MQKVIGVLVFVAIAGGIFWFRGNQDDRIEQKVEAARFAMMDVIAASKDREKFVAFMDEHVDSADEYAVRISYTPRARRQPAKFDAQKYAAAFCESLLQKQKFLKGDNQALSLYLRQLEIDAENAVKSGKFDEAAAE